MGEQKLNFYVNIGVGDSVFHEIEQYEFDTVENTGEVIRVMAYPVESIISEKFDILLRRFELNDCMRHLYDIFLLLQTFDFDGYEFQRALNQTLEIRQNDCSYSRLEQISSLAEDIDMQNRWRHFKTVNNIEYTFSEVLQRVFRFTGPVWSCILQERKWQKNWSAISGNWQEDMFLY